MIATPHIALDVNPSVFEGASLYAERKGLNIDALIQEYLSSVAALVKNNAISAKDIQKANSLDELDDWTRQFVGVMHCEEGDINGRKAREEYLMEKYG